MNSKDLEKTIDIPFFPRKMECSSNYILLKAIPTAIRYDMRLDEEDSFFAWNCIKIERLL